MTKYEKAQETVRETINNYKHGRHNVKNLKQAIAIRLSKARIKGEKVPPRKK